MSASDYLNDSASEQLQKEFLAIVESPGNHIDSYQAAAERITARPEVADDRGIKERFVVLDKSGKLVPSSLAWATKGQIRLSGHDPRATDSNAIVRIHRPVFVEAGLHDEAQAHTSSIGYSLYYRICWIFIGAAALIWGFVFGASAVGAGWIDLTTGVAGTIGVLGLMVTLFVAGRRSTQSS